MKTHFWQILIFVALTSNSMFQSVYPQSCYETSIVASAYPGGVYFYALQETPRQDPACRTGRQGED